jgi:hypothetical protein
VPSRLLKEPLAGCSKGFRGGRNLRDRVRENVVEIPNEHEHVPRTRILFSSLLEFADSEAAYERQFQRGLENVDAETQAKQIQLDTFFARQR